MLQFQTRMVLHLACQISSSNLKSGMNILRVHLSLSLSVSLCFCLCVCLCLCVFMYAKQMCTLANRWRWEKESSVIFSVIFCLFWNSFFYCPCSSTGSQQVPAILWAMLDFLCECQEFECRSSCLCNKCYDLLPPAEISPSPSIEITVGLFALSFLYPFLRGKRYMTLFHEMAFNQGWDDHRNPASWSRWLVPEWL